MAPDGNVLLPELQALLAYPRIKQLPLGRLPAPQPRIHAWSTSISISYYFLLPSYSALPALPWGFCASLELVDRMQGRSHSPNGMDGTLRRPPERSLICSMACDGLA